MKILNYQDDQQINLFLSEHRFTLIFKDEFKCKYKKYKNSMLQVLPRTRQFL